jgi:hypothetical protein
MDRKLKASEENGKPDGKDDVEAAAMKEIS